MTVPHSHDYMTIALVSLQSFGGRIAKYKTSLTAIPDILKGNKTISAFDLAGNHCSVELKKHGKSVYAIFCHPKMWEGVPDLRCQSEVAVMWPRVEEKGDQDA